jgi:hypothetical protein
MPSETDYSDGIKISCVRLPPLAAANRIPLSIGFLSGKVLVLNPTYAVAGIALRADWDEIPTFHGDIYCKFPRCACSGLCKKLERLFVSCYFLEKFSKK